MSVANRSVPAARELAERFGGHGIPLGAISEELRSADIVICPTQSPFPILTRAEIEQALDGRGSRPLVLIDIAVPRDVDPELRHTAGVILRDIDDLERVVSANLNGRLREARRAEQIVEEELRRLLTHERLRSLEPERTTLSGLRAVAGPLRVPRADLSSRGLV